MRIFLKNKARDPINFFKLLYGLEKDGNFEKLRISSDTKMGFPTNAIQSVYQLNEQSIEIKATFFGLYGVSSVLPPFMNELALNNSVSGEELRDFLDIFQKRLYTLKYQIWKHGYSPFFINSCQTPYAKLLRSISGDRLPDSLYSPAYSVAGFLSKRSHSVLNLIKIFRALTGFSTKIEENIAQWIPYSKKTSECSLGENILLGGRYLENRQLFFIKINCVIIENVQKLYQNKICFKQLKSIIRSCLDPSMRYELFLEARKGFVQTCLGNTSVGLSLGGTLGGLSIEKNFSIKLNCDCE